MFSPLESLGVVFSVDVQLPKRPRTKSCRAAVGKVADHQQVAGLMRAGEARAATDAVGAEPDRALKEPEPLLRVAAIVQTIRAEEDDVADGCVPTRAVGARRQGVTDREGM